MTFIFTFPIKDAWVCVSDRLVVGTFEAVTRDGQEVTIRVENKTKLLHLSNGLIFGGAGNVEVLDLAKDLLEQTGLANFRQNIRAFVNNQHGIFGALKTELFVIDPNNQTCVRFDLDAIRLRPMPQGVTDITTCDEGYLGFPEATHLDNATAKLLRRQNYTFRPTNEQPLLRQCIGILEDISKEKLDAIGHPSIDGCNIWIVGKKRVRKYFVYPKDYDIMVQND